MLSGSEGVGWMQQYRCGWCIVPAVHTSLVYVEKSSGYNMVINALAKQHPGNSGISPVKSGNYPGVYSLVDGTSQVGGGLRFENIGIKQQKQSNKYVYHFL